MACPGQASGQLQSDREPTGLAYVTSQTLAVFLKVSKIAVEGQKPIRLTGACIMGCSARRVQASQWLTVEVAASYRKMASAAESGLQADHSSKI